MDSVRVEQLEREGLVRTAWVPFELHPEAPVEGIPREAYFGRARSEQMRNHLQSVAAEVGLTMESRDVIINSRRALGAAEFARRQGKFVEMHHALFKAHWERTARLEDVDDLVDVGASVGLDREELRLAIEDGRYEPLIDESRREAESVGINAIPAHVFGGRYLVVGAQPYEVFQRVLDRLRAEAPIEP
ncbi:MAG TPA: DsbA family protein [Candidatus Dormibacteraeota bacterium]|nr:DsbA family protein [Candidatus Dormibacteraeota bacterium]